MTSTVRDASTDACCGAQAIAHPNIALVKYWGKSELPGNVPAVPSLSITLDNLCTRTRVLFDPALDADQVCMNDTALPAHAAATQRISESLDAFRALARCSLHARVNTCNNFPTGAGLASSASGFAALAVAADAALNTGLDRSTLSRMARRASASAGRSLLGGFATLADAATAADPAAEPLAPAAHWPLEVVVAVCQEGTKQVGSSAGMRASALTSPFYGRWLETAPADLATATRSVLERDFKTLTQVAEASCLKMHAVMQSTRPALLYWNAATMNVLQQIRALQQGGVQVFFTMDAGPQVKAVCIPADAPQVATALAEVPGVSRILRCGLGEGARVDHD